MALTNPFGNHISEIEIRKLSGIWQKVTGVSDMYKCHIQRLGDGQSYTDHYLVRIDLITFVKFTFLLNRE